jgi:predicted NBD/HSP70 family sugar kinase
METYLGLDLGGTKLLIGEVCPDGRVLNCKNYPSGYLTQKEALDRIESSLEDYLAARRSRQEGLPKAMGLGMVGRVDYERGIWRQIDLRRTEEMPVAEILSRKYGMPCFIENDVRSALRGELRFGSGQETGDFIYLNIGTGIAAGFVSGGHIIRGGHVNSGEVGHTTVGIDAGLELPCECGRINCVEMLAAGIGLDACARALAPEYPGTSLSIPAGESRVKAEEIFALSGSDPLCARLTETAVKALAGLIMNLTRTTDPEMVILGGGLVSGGFLYPRILEALNKNTMRFVTRGVVLTKLNPAYAGLLGAAAAAMYGLERRG